MTNEFGRLCSHPILVAVVAIITLFAPAGLYAQTVATVTGKSGDAIALPPVEQFLEGDQWNAYDARASGTAVFLGKTVNVIGHVLVRKRNGTWVLDNNDTVDNALKSFEHPDARIFSDLHLQPLVFPKNPRESELYVSHDGLLHQFRGGVWLNVALGATLGALRGDRTVINIRMTVTQAEDLNGISAERPARAVVPTLDKQVPGARIGWLYNLAEGMQAAKKDGKLIVVVFQGRNSNWSDLFVTHVLRCPTFNTLAGQAHFLLLLPYFIPDDSTKLATGLGIETLPALSILLVKGSAIEEKSRLVGAADEEQVLQIAQRAGLTSRTPGQANTAAMPLGTILPGGCLPTRHPALDKLPSARVTLPEQGSN